MSFDKQTLPGLSEANRVGSDRPSGCMAHDDRKSKTIVNRRKSKRPRIAEQIVRLALQHYRLGRTDKDELFAVPRNGHNHVIILKGGGDALRSKLAKVYRQETGQTPNGGALTDAMTVLSGYALDAETEPVYLRLAPYKTVSFLTWVTQWAGL